MTVHNSAAYGLALNAYNSAEVAFLNASVEELARLMPEGVDALYFVVNDTPRLTFDAFRDADGEEWDATDFDRIDSDAYEAIDAVAMSMGFTDWEGADSWLMRDPQDDERFIVERSAT